ncbi:putative efflux protein, MATE family [Roseovarius azorensis]|uniref:Putative efflux protein, MATE family n=1 Tax=Roseovarius azorensis TaxID=1287727 RepID=A0A1H7VHW3_9RHOB|nr:MATE family efflux transporter [Roseovarius azorensis]SEM08499.1 putative efflux protein, MATE family [Roseovarius azorensis]
MALSETGAHFTTGNLFRHVSVMSLTSSIGLMAIFAVDLLDIVFISMLGREELAAAAGYASVIMFFASAINIGLSIAAGALVARALGENNHVDAREFASSSAVIAVGVGLVLPLLALPNMAFLLGLAGADGPVAEMAAGYLWIILPTTFMSGLSMVTVAVLRAYGDARGAMYPALLGAGVNAVLDPILIFTLGLELQGAAMATVLARLATVGLAMGLAIHRYRAFARPRPQCVARDFRETAMIALPAVLGTVATPVGTAIVTREMAKYGSDAVAALAVINRMIPVVFSVVLALSGAIGPIFGQNFGAGRMDRVQETFSDGLKFLALYVVVMSGLLFVLRDPLADLFEATGMMRSLLYLYLGPLALASFFNGAIFVSNASFNNLGHPSYSTGVNWARHTLGTWPFAIAFGAVWGAHGVLIGQAVGGAIFAAVAVWLGLRVIAAPCRDPLKLHYKCPDQRMQVVTNRTGR